MSDQVVTAVAAPLKAKRRLSRGSLLLWGALCVVLVGIIGRNVLLHYRRMALFEAARQGDTVRLHDLLRQGVDPNAKIEAESNTFGKTQTTPLLTAAQNSNWKAVHVLLQAGADARINNHGESALAYAVQQQNADMVQELLQHHADPNLSGNTTLSGNEYLIFEAIKRGSMAIIKALLEAGANPNALTSQGGSRILTIVINRGSTAAARRNLMSLLIAHGADVNARNLMGTGSYREGGETQLMTAVYKGDLEVVRFLLAHGASPNARCTPVVQTPLPQGRAQAQRSGYQTPIQNVVETPLRLARQAKRQDIIDVLLQAGAKD